MDRTGYRHQEDMDRTGHRHRGEMDRRGHGHREDMDRRDHGHRGEMDRRVQRYRSEASPWTEIETMNSALWSMLPSHLLEIILASLPLDSLCHLSTVCKMWNRLVRSRRFMQVWAETPCRAPWLLFFTLNTHTRDILSTHSTNLTKNQLGGNSQLIYAYAYDSESNKWHCLQLCYILDRCEYFTSGTSLASDGGLVCYFSYGNKFESIVVSNPLTKTYRTIRLPPLLGKLFTMTMLAMVVDRVSNTYMVVVAVYFKSDGGSFQNKAEVYDSRTETWTTTGNIPFDGMEDEIVYFGKPVFCHGVLYVWNSARQNRMLLTCDLDRGVWNELRAPLPVPATFEELLEWQGRILMVGTRLGTPEDSMGVHSTCIWELQAMSLKWIEVDQMPTELFDVCFGDPALPRANMTVIPFKAGQFVYIFSFNPHDYSGHCKLVAYNLSNRTWQNPRNVSNVHVFGRRPWQIDEVLSYRTLYREGMFYEPRFDITP